MKEETYMYVGREFPSFQVLSAPLPLRLIVVACLMMHYELNNYSIQCISHVCELCAYHKGEIVAF